MASGDFVRRILVLLLGVVGVSSAVSLLYIATRSEDERPGIASGEVQVIESSFAFDVSNKRYIAGYADALIVVSGAQRVSQSEPYTTYRLSVSKVLKGKVGTVITGRQLGYVDKTGVTHQTEDQPLLGAGKAYVLALSRDARGYTIIGGPAAAAPTNGDSNNRVGNGSAVIGEYEQAVREQRQPPGVPPVLSP